MNLFDHSEVLNRIGNFQNQIWVFGEFVLETSFAGIMILKETFSDLFRTILSVLIPSVVLFRCCWKNVILTKILNCLGIGSLTICTPLQVGAFWCFTYLMMTLALGYLALKEYSIYSSSKVARGNVWCFISWRWWQSEGSWKVLIFGSCSRGLVARLMNALLMFVVSYQYCFLLW